MSLQRNVVRRAATYYLRIAVPADLAPSVGRREVWKSLKTKDAGRARVRAAIALFKILSEFDRLRRMAVFDREGMAWSLYATVYGDPETIERRKRDAQSRASITSEMPPHEIDELVKEYYDQLLRDEEDWRIGDRPTVDLDVEGSFDWPFLETYGETPDEVRAYCSARQIKMADLVRYEDAQQSLEHFQDRINKGDWRAGEDVVEPFLASKALVQTISETDYRRLCHRLLHALCDGLRARVAWFEGNWGFSPHSPYVRDAILPRSRPEPSMPRKASRGASKGKGTISVQAERYIKEKGVTDPKSRAEHEKTLKLLEDWFGPEKQVDSYTKDDIIAFKDALAVLPSNFNKFFRNMGMKLAIERNVDDGRPTLNSYTIQRKLDHVRRFFDWAVINNLLEANPAAAIKVASRKPKKSDRKPFRIDELQDLFRSPLFLGCRSKGRWKEPGAHKIRDHRYWLPLLALWTGARQAELAQLWTTDIKTLDGVMVISITDADDDDALPGGSIKRVKNASSIRQVPVHQQLHLLGFPKYVDRVRRSKSPRLFPECERANDGSFSPYSKHFKNLLTATGIKRRGVVFHSFRHSFEDAMRVAKLQDEVRSRITGREYGGSVGLYGEGYLASTLSEEINKVRYEGLDLSALYDVA